MHIDKRLTILLAAVLVAGATFGITYALRGDDSVGSAQPQATPPSAVETPDPGTTPDTSQPFWHVPYVNQDRERPAFVGTLNGYVIDPAAKGRTGFEVCPGTGMEPVRNDVLLDVVSAPGPLRINPASFPEGVSSLTQPDAFLCGAELGQVSWILHVAAGTPNVNVGGSDLTIGRIRGNDILTHTAPEERWTAVQINGQPAVGTGPIVVVGEALYGGCFLAIHERDSDVLTTVQAGAARLEFCITLAEAVIE